MAQFVGLMVIGFTILAAFADGAGLLFIGAIILGMTLKSQGQDAMNKTTRAALEPKLRQVDRRIEYAQYIEDRGARAVALSRAHADERKILKTYTAAKKGARHTANLAGVGAFAAPVFGTLMLAGSWANKAWVKRQHKH